MPYIKQECRKMYDESIDNICCILRHREAIDAAGEFTYIVYRLLKRFSGKFWMRAIGIGCLVCVILEIYRRDHSDYEDEKIQQNGDVR